MVASAAIYIHSFPQTRQNLINPFSQAKSTSRCLTNSVKTPTANECYLLVCLNQLQDSKVWTSLSINRYCLSTLQSRRTNSMNHTDSTWYDLSRATLTGGCPLVPAPSISGALRFNAVFIWCFWLPRTDTRNWISCQPTTTISHNHIAFRVEFR